MKSQFFFPICKEFERIEKFAPRTHIKKDRGKPGCGRNQVFGRFFCAFSKKIKKYFADIKNVYIFAVSIKTNRPAGLPEQKN